MNSQTANEEVIIFSIDVLLSTVFKMYQCCM